MQDGNIARAFQIGNRLGRDPFRRPTRLRLQNADAIGGNSNYILTVPILTLPGRGLNLALNLYYNSQLWTNGAPPGQTDLVFGHDADWPAPGWSLGFSSVGFGKVVQVGNHGGVLVDADGTSHPYAAGEVSNAPPNACAGPPDCFQVTAHTTDGSLIDYTVISDDSNLRSATVKYPNGTTVTYGLGPTQIADANGNIMSVKYGSYISPGSPAKIESKIETITDTLGRVVNFEYDSNNSNILTAITAPKVGGGTRTIVRFYYKTARLTYSFASGIQFSAPSGSLTVIEGISFPATATGYWFGDEDSYSSYGMISKVSQRRDMILSEQGKLTPGTMTHENIYNYPNAGSGLALSDVPKYTQMTETWAGMDVSPTVTKYSVTRSSKNQNWSDHLPRWILRQSVPIRWRKL